MNVLNLSNVNLPKLEEGKLPDIVVVDEHTPKEKIERYAYNFITAYVGKPRYNPIIDYAFRKEEELIDFLKEYERMSIRERIARLYDRYFNTTFPKVVNRQFIYYFGHTKEVFEKLVKLLRNPLKPWVNLIGQRGSGKLALVRSILGKKFHYFYDVSDFHVGFKRMEDEKIDDVVVEVGLFSNERQLLQVVSFLHSQGYQAIFFVDDFNLPEIIATVPSLYLPSFSERVLKERLLILEHILRRLKCKCDMERKFFEAFVMYPWMGNISELENTLRYMISLEMDSLKFENMPEHIKGFFDEDYNLRIVELYTSYMLDRLNYEHVSFKFLKNVPLYIQKKLLQELMETAKRKGKKPEDILKFKDEAELKEFQELRNKLSQL